MADLAAGIMKDPALSARTLALANSAFFGRRRAIDTVERALSTLGVENVQACALTGALMEALGCDRDAPIDMKAFWQESLLRACIARALAESVDPTLSSRAYLASLLADVAVPLLADEDACYAQGVGDVHCCQASICVMEQDVGEARHADVAAELCEAWNLPESLLTPIQNHHEPPPASLAVDPATRLWQIAYVAGNLPLTRLGDSNLRVLGVASRCFGHDPERIGETLEVGIARFGALVEVFSQALPDDCSPEEVMELARSLARLRATDAFSG